MGMTATERLRALLNERGVEWETDRSGNRVMWGRPVDPFHDTMEFKAVDNALPNGGLNVHICGFTPEQAIAATLGAGTCELVNAAEDLGDGTSSCMCDKCGYTALDDWWDEFNFCPNCGRRIEVDDG